LKASDQYRQFWQVFTDFLLYSPQGLFALIKGFYYYHRFDMSREKTFFFLEGHFFWKYQEMEADSLE